MSRWIRRRRERGDRGAALLETLLVFPVFMVVILGIFEFGLIYRDSLSAGDAVGNAARRGAVLGPRQTDTGVNADYEIIREVRNSLSGIPTDWVDRIVIFQAQGPAHGSAVQQVPSACKTGDSVSGVCNVYYPAQAFLAVQANTPASQAYFACPSGRACSWPPTTRQNGPTVAEIDYLGVYIRISRPYVSGLFGDEFTIERAFVARLEPGVIQ